MTTDCRKNGDILVCLYTSDLGYQTLSLMRKDTDHEIMVKVFLLNEDEPCSIEDFDDTEDLYEFGFPWNIFVKANPSDGQCLDSEMSYSDKSNSQYAEYYTSYVEYLAKCDLNEI